MNLWCLFDDWQTTTNWTMYSLIYTVKTVDLIIIVEYSVQWNLKWIHYTAWLPLIIVYIHPYFEAKIHFQFSVQPRSRKSALTLTFNFRSLQLSVFSFKFLIQFSSGNSLQFDPLHSASFTVRSSIIWHSFFSLTLITYIVQLFGKLKLAISF